MLEQGLYCSNTELRVFHLTGFFNISSIMKETKNVPPELTESFEKPARIHELYLMVQSVLL